MTSRMLLESTRVGTTAIRFHSRHISPEATSALEAMRVLCHPSRLRSALALPPSLRSLCFFCKADELDFEEDVYSEHFVNSVHLSKQLRESALAIEQATEKLRIPCYLKDDPDDISTRNCSARLALAEELGGHHPTIRSLTDSFKIHLSDAVESGMLFRCLYCQTFYSGSLREVDQLDLPCAVGGSEENQFRCKTVPVAFDDLFRRVANLWAKRLMFQSRLSA